MSTPKSAFFAGIFWEIRNFFEIYCTLRSLAKSKPWNHDNFS